jgi:hypothetical protein
MTTLLHLDLVVFLVAKAAALLAALALIWRAEIRPSLFRWVAIGAALVVSFDLYVLFSVPGIGVDYQFFRRAGNDVWAGLDPYDESRFALHPFLNPPTALPVFALFALLPERSGFAVWTALNVVACLALPAYSRRVLAGQAHACDPATRASWLVPSWAISGLTAALIISDAARSGLYIGQLSILTALLLLAALDAQARRRPILGGIWLALATIKVATMLPFLLLFLRKGDGRTWASLIVTCALLIAITGHAAELPDHLTALIERIERLGAPGKVNDYSFEGARNAGILGFDHALYRLGLRDRRMIRIVQSSALILTGLWIARHVVLQRMPRDTACSLVACYSTIFLYHRNYDTVILALPLVLFTGKTLSRSGRTLTSALGATSILIIIYLNLNTMTTLTNTSMNRGLPGRWVQAIVLPYATWLILLCMLLLVYGQPARRADDVPGGSALT